MTPWTAASQVSLSFTISWSLLKFVSIELVMPSNCLIFCHPLLVLPSVFPSIRGFSNVEIMQGSGVKQQIYSVTVLEVRNMKCISVDRNQGVGRITLLSGGSRESPFFVFFIFEKLSSFLGPILHLQIQKHQVKPISHCFLSDFLSYLPCPLLRTLVIKWAT